jgi:hypothetical protein
VQDFFMPREAAGWVGVVPMQRSGSERSATVDRSLMRGFSPDLGYVAGLPDTEHEYGPESRSG